MLELVAGHPCVPTRISRFGPQQGAWTDRPGHAARATAAASLLAATASDPPAPAVTAVPDGTTALVGNHASFAYTIAPVSIREIERSS